MKVENSIKENYSATTVKPLENIEETIDAICEWNGITRTKFNAIVGAYSQVGVSDGKPIYAKGERIFDPIKEYILNTYQGKEVVFEKGNDKFFGKLNVMPETTRYMLEDKVIEIDCRIYAENKDTGERITLFPKTNDIVQSWMKSFYVVNNGRADRQRVEKEIMAKLIELAKIRGGNEIVSTQNAIEELQIQLKKRGIDMTITNGVLVLDFPRRTIRDTAKEDDDFIAPPIQVQMDFESQIVQNKGYSPHGFGTPNSWGSPCWGNWATDISKCLRDCDIKQLINLIISWAYGYNSADTGRAYDGRHPVAKLRDYIWYLYENQHNTREIELAKEHYEEIKKTLDLDHWFDSCSTALQTFILSLGKTNETETASEG